MAAPENPAHLAMPAAPGARAAAIASPMLAGFT
jgi:hypothetical protein